VLPSRLLAVALVVVVAVLAPMACAAHVDQTWIAGVYDAADQDDGILAALSIECDSVAQPVVETGARR
jgi:hypothetical protein